MTRRSRQDNKPKLMLILLGVAWVLLVIPIALLASTPTSNFVQVILGAIVVISIICLKPFSHSVPVRVLLLALASVLVMRYWIWRLTSTLPTLDDPIAFTGAVILFIVETYAIVVFFLTVFITADPYERKLPPQIKREELPTVDILVPSYNEPVEMLAVTLSAAKHMVYPPEKRTVVLCDDGGTDQKCNDPDFEKSQEAIERRKTLQQLCANLGVTYTTRERNEHAKAGNMTSALEKLSGDLVVVFDADHVPSRDFLARTVGHFVENPKLFLVQTPHFFINRDPIERNLDLAETCPSENEMFYGKIHNGLDRWSGAFFCGSAAVLRRKALDEAGGFSGQTITEDAETALDIHSKGWESLYINRAMIAGLQPETFASFIQQRGRWATGMTQMLMLKNPIFRSGLTIAQRMCYVNSMSFWLFPVVRLGFLITPLFYLFFGYEIFVATRAEVAAYMLTYLATVFLVQNTLFTKHRWPLISEVYEVAQAPYLVGQIFKTVVRPRAAKFNVTSKTETLNNDYISPIYLPLLITFVLMVLGVVAAAIRWFLFPGDRPIVEIVGGWAIFNFLLTGLALRAISEKQQRRKAPRVEMSVPAQTFLVKANTISPAIDTTIVDASTSGAKLELRVKSPTAQIQEVIKSINRGTIIEFIPEFPEAPWLQQKVRAIVQGVSYEPKGVSLGVRFEQDQPTAAFEAVAYLIFGDSENWRRMRDDDKKAKGLLAGLLYVLWLSLKTIPLTIFELIKEPARRRREEDEQMEKLPPVHLMTFGADFEAPRAGDDEHENEDRDDDTADSEENDRSRKDQNAGRSRSGSQTRKQDEQEREWSNFISDEPI